MIKNKVNPVAAEGARSCEGAVVDGGVEMEENGWRRRCLLISVVEGNVKPQTGRHAGILLWVLSHLLVGFIWSGANVHNCTLLHFLPVSVSFHTTLFWSGD